MSKITDTLNINLSKKVQNGIPLAFLNIPVPEPRRDIKIVSSGNTVLENVAGLSLKDSSNSINIIYNIPSNSLATTGVLSNNKFSDPDFANGSTYWTYSPSGSFNFLNTSYRTSQNSFYNTGEDPIGGTTCLQINYSNTSPSQEILFYSEAVSAIAAPENGYTWNQVAYQLSFWAATDPVDESNNRVGSSTVSALNSVININVEYYNNSNTLVSSSVLSSPTYQDPLTKPLFVQPNFVYLRYLSPIITLPSSSVSSLRIRVSTFGCQGMYFDDFKLRSFVYTQIPSINSSNQSITSTGLTQTFTTTIAGSSLLGNPSLLSATGLTYSSNLNSPSSPIQKNSTAYNMFLTNYSSNPNVFVDSSINGGYWSGTGVSIMSSGSSLYSTYGGSCRIPPDFYKLSKNWMMLSAAGQYLEYTFPLYSGMASSNIVLSIYEKVSQGSANSNVSSNLRAIFKDSNYTVLGSAVGTNFTSSTNYTNRTLTFNSSGYPTCAYVTVRITSVSVTGNYAHIFDDVAVYLASNPVTGWTFNTAHPIDGSGLVEEYMPTNGFSNLELIYLSGGVSGDPHIFFSNRPIYNANNVFAYYDINYLNAYLNTEDILVSSNYPISGNTTYNVSFNLYWPDTTVNISPPPYRPLSTGNVVDSFTAPFTAFNVNTSTGSSISSYGYVKVFLEGLNATGGVTETYINQYGIDQGNLPTTYVHDTVNGYYYSNINSSRVSFTNAQTVSGRIRISISKAYVGIGNITFTPYMTYYNAFGTVTPTGTYTSQNFYKIVSPILVDGIDVDYTDAWRLKIKDGYFEKRYVVPTNEPSNSWLIKAGFNVGDDLTLIYTIPEYNLTPRFNLGKHIDEKYRVPALQIDDKTLYLGRPNITAISELIINGNSIISNYTQIDALVSVYPSIVSSVDGINGTIVLVQSVSDRDDVVVSYYHKQNRYIYRGYYNDSSWNDLDLNPNASHKYHIDTNSYGSYGRELINNIATVYLLPIAAYKNGTPGTYTYTTAFDVDPKYRVTSFVRHSVGPNVPETQSNIIPSAVVLAKVFIDSPNSDSDIILTDIRPRGGGYDSTYDPLNPPKDFIQETRYRVPNNNIWNPTSTYILLGDSVTIYGIGTSLDTSGNVLTSNNILYGNISTGTPAGTGFLIGNSYTFTATSSGFLFLSIVSSSMISTGSLYTKVIIKRNITQKAIWDSGTWDGIPTMTNGAVVFEVSKNILSGTNGYTKFTSQEIEDIVKKNCPAGILPIIRYV